MIFSLIEQIIDNLSKFSNSIDSIVLKGRESSKNIEETSPQNVSLLTENSHRIITPIQNINDTNINKHSIGLIDGSTRRIRYNIATIYLAGVAIYDKIIKIYPSLQDIYNLSKILTPFIAIKAPRYILYQIENTINTDLVYTRSPIGREYDEEYDEDSISDELRTRIETKTLEELIRENYNDVIIIDGPIYFAYPALVRDDHYARAQRKLIKERTQILNNSKIPVIGIAKRIEKSRKICKCREFIDLICREFKLRGIENLEDVIIVECIANRLKLRKFIVGPFKSMYVSNKIDGYVIYPDRVFWYVYVEQPHVFKRIFRIEVLYEHYRKYYDIIEDTIHVLLNNLSMSGLPLPLDIVDRFAKKSTAILYRQAVVYSLVRGISITHDTYEEYVSIRREYGD